MDQFVIKRNGKYVPFEAFKIEDALKKGFSSVQLSYDPSIFEKLVVKLESRVGSGGDSGFD